VKLSEENESDAIALRAAERMMQHDKAATALGVMLDAVSAGYARMSMLVRDDMVNGFGICHGGVTFSLADTAFAYACNSRNKKSIALSCTINYLAAVQPGDVLTATAEEKSLGGRIGLYDVRVVNQKDMVVAEFRGTSYGTSQTVVE
jgi:acyl-CoA thioesterase